MQWNSEYETGIAEIDDQHQTIMRLVVELETAVTAGAHWSNLHPLITRAKEYTKFHFAVEESLMQVFKYPRLSAHRAEHRFVLERVASLEGRVLRTEEIGDLIPQFRTWLLGHFLDSDRHFVEFMRKAVPVVGEAAAPVDEEPVRPDTDALARAMRRAVGLEQKATIISEHPGARAPDWIAWDSLVATKFAGMDADHRELVRLFNKLGEAAVAGKTDRECIPLLDEIIRHTREHFAFEERLMQEYAYPHAAEHSAEHVALIDQALQYRAKFEAGSSESYIPLFDFPDDWLRQHIARMDKPLGEFLAYAA